MQPCRGYSHLNRPAPEGARLQLGLAGTCDVRAGSQAAASEEEAGGREDSQLEYISASEEGFGDGDSWSELCEQREAALKCTDALCDAAGGRAAKEEDVGDVEGCPRAAGVELAQLFQHCLLGSSVACSRQAPLSDVAGSTLITHANRSREGGYPQLHHSEVKGDGTQTAAASRVPRQNSGCVHGDLLEQESLSLPQTQRALATATQLCKSTGDSEFYSGEDPLLCVCGAAKVAGSQRPAPAALTSKDLRCGEQAAGNSYSADATTSLHMERCESSVDVSSKSQVNQAVDASSDFRVCFTTSRSTTTRVPLLSRAVNTEITMINKFRHVNEETFARVARRLLFEDDPALEMGSQLADRHQDGSAAAAERRSLVKEQRECSGDVKISTDRWVVDCSPFGVLDARPARLDEEAVRNAASSHCQNLLQRAIEAELQVLNAHYQMCYQRCLKIYRLAWEENACCSGHHGNTSANSEVGSSVLSALEELKKNYSSMRSKIQTGTPLNALPPLSVEIKSLPTAASYIPCKLLREELCSGSLSDVIKAGFEASKLQEMRNPSDVGSAQTMCFTDDQQPAASASSEVSQGQPQEQGVQHGRVRDREWSEYWFDAEEDCTDFLLLSAEAGRHREEQGVVGVREAKVAEGARGCSFVCVGGLSSAVSEGDLRSHFQKYQISVLQLCVDSDNRRCAFLGFKDTAAAKLAVEEMNKREIKGEACSVELVGNPSAHAPWASRILGEKLWHEALRVHDSASSSQNETLPSASGSEQVPGTSFAPEVSPNASDSSSFAKLMKKLAAIHPEATRDKIASALLEVKKSNHGVLRGLSINSIIEKASVILRKPTPACEGSVKK
ncbi:RNA-binding protein 44 [Cyrtonyx montezumae]|uniref:RNA-binding protein 44 n=1 Tax=Cyrtonyx montezumae TaxID=9017 RepID=UPI0032DA8578